MLEPAGVELQVDVRWCPDCDADRTVCVVQLDGDPEPIAVCADCGAGISVWISPDFLAAVSGAPGARPARGAA